MLSPIKYIKFRQAAEPVPPPPCEGCGACCKGGLNVELSARELNQFPHDGKHLARDDNGYCIFYEDGCSIYDHRPKACRRFDCRDLAANMIESPNLLEHGKPPIHELLDWTDSDEYQQTVYAKRRLMAGEMR